MITYNQAQTCINQLFEDSDNVTDKNSMIDQFNTYMSLKKQGTNVDMYTDAQKNNEISLRNIISYLNNFITFTSNYLTYKITVSIKPTSISGYDPAYETKVTTEKVVQNHTNSSNKYDNFISIRRSDTNFPTAQLSNGTSITIDDYADMNKIAKTVFQTIDNKKISCIFDFEEYDY